MALRLATAALAAVAIAAGPAFACKGPTVVFADNFQTANAAWYGNLTISNGNASVPANPQQFPGAFYGGMFMDSGDICVDVVGPAVQDPSTVSAGIIFGFTDVANFYVFLVQENGQAEVVRSLNGAFLRPVTMRAAPALKTGGNVTNTLRITWKDTSATAYINDQPFITFNIQALENSMIGLYVEADAPAANIYQFSNLQVTNVP